MPFASLLRREGALAEIGAAGEAEQRFDAHVGVLDGFAAIADDPAGETIERLARESGQEGREGQAADRQEEKQRDTSTCLSDLPLPPIQPLPPILPLPPFSAMLPFRDRV